MTERKIAILGITLATVCSFSTAANAQQPYDVTNCRAGTVTVLQRTDDVFIRSFDYRGILRSNLDSKLFDSFTLRCFGLVSTINKQTKGGGHCKVMDPNGDIVLVDWQTSDKPGVGPFTWVHGTGKWKGISGGGTYQTIASGRPVDEGTFQACGRDVGTVTLPK